MLENSVRHALRVANLDCEHDAAAIKRGLRDEPGVLSVEVYPRSAKVVLTYDPGRTSPATLEGRLASLGFPPATLFEMPHPPALWRNPKVILSLVSGALLAAGWAAGHMAGLPVATATLLYLASLLVGGYYFGREAFEGLVEETRVGIELLMAVAAVVAVAAGQVAEGAALAFLYSISEALEGYTEDKTRFAIRALMELAPKKALVRRNGAEEEIPVEGVRVGDVLIVKPGQAIPTDGVIVAGTSTVDESPVTGESLPVEKREGMTVFAGSINGPGTLEVRATRTVRDNTLARIMQMVEEAQERKGQTQRFIERFGARYSPLVLLGGLLVATVPPLVWGQPWQTWAIRAAVFIVAAAPCALVLSVPLTFVATLGTAARHGVLIKGGIYLEELARVRVVALDKTGTLTTGRHAVTDVIPLNGHSPQEVLSAAAAVEVYSEHPLAAAVVRAAEERGIPYPRARDVRMLPGVGAMGKLDGRHILVARPEEFPPRTISSTLGRRISALREQGKTVILVAESREGDFEKVNLLGAVALADRARGYSREVIEELRRLRVSTVMLTGDNERAALAIARDLGIDRVHAALKPEDKVAIVKELMATHRHVAMVGDGINDAPALATASVGIAMGAAGADVAMETADVVLMADDLGKVPFALRLARRSRRVLWENLAFSLVVIAIMVAGAVTGFLSLPVAVIGHELSEFAVVGNSLRMLKG